MLRLAIVAAILAAASPSAAQFKGYFDVSHLELRELAEPKWGRRMDGGQLLYLCIAANGCPPPTGLTIKGVLRADRLEDSFASGDLMPAKLAEQGKANAERTGSEFLEARAIRVANLPGVHMEAAANLGGKVYFVTKWIGRGERLLDIKATSGDLALARKLADAAAAALVPQVFE
ncbi:MAG: hypothetical protein AB1749_15685 [Pseudomonadota bacterium]